MKSSLNILTSLNQPERKRRIKFFLMAAFVIAILLLQASDTIVFFLAKHECNLLLESLLAFYPTFNPKIGETTLLHLAVSTQNEKLVTLLIERGADPNERDVLGRTPLHELFSGIYFRPSPLAWSIAKTLLQRGGNPNIPDKLGGTPLHLASSQPKIPLEVIELLLENKANPKVVGPNDKTPIDMARACGRGDVEKLLLEGHK